ncbi:MAG: zinc ribbon domain-containing protein [Halobacteriales archaeon]|nr:zinc ribbon domain-containing protein [Halobacteriales archaeon]
MPSCPECDQPVLATDSFCAHCGTELSGEASPTVFSITERSPQLNAPKWWVLIGLQAVAWIAIFVSGLLSNEMGLALLEDLFVFSNAMLAIALIIATPAYWIDSYQLRHSDAVAWLPQPKIYTVLAVTTVGLFAFYYLFQRHRNVGIP